MRPTAKLIIFSAAFLLISLVSCKPRKAIAFKEAIVQKERVAFNILLDKNGSQAKKLECLIKKDYKGALALVDQQEQEFNQLIRGIVTLSTGDIKQGDALKMAAVNYYGALKELQAFDRVEIANQEACLYAKDEALRVAQHKILELSLQKQQMYRKVYEKEKVFAEALEKFNTVNKL